MNPTPRPSIRLLVGVIVVAPVLIVCAVLVTLSTMTSRQIAQNLGDSYVQSAAMNVRNQVGRYLADAVRVSEQYTRRMRRGALTADNLDAWEPVMLDDLLTTRSIASICFGRADGDSTWLLWNKERLEVGRGRGEGPTNAVEHVMRLDGSIDPQPIRVYHYDPRLRPWWKVAIDANRPTWTPIYFWFGTTALDGTASTGYTRIIRDGEGKMLGVLIVDVTLGDIGEFLLRLSVSAKAYFFILDEQGLIVATSHGRAIGGDGQRITLAQHESPAAKIADDALRGLAPEEETQTVRHSLEGDAVRVHTTRFVPYDGIAWRLVTVLPESVYASEAAASLQRQILLSLAAILGGILLALMLARQVTRPLLTLERHVRRVGEGDFNSRLELDAARELRVLSDAINQMAAGLRDRMKMQQAMTVAQEVQQALLPAQGPSLEGLDVIGRSRYCDATGGDYFDFIPIQRHGRATSLIAVGDVMGHGVAAALLMTSARAALRVHSHEETDLGKLLTRVNALLAGDARHGSFMTMSLMDVDARSRCLHWASAGQDLPVVYHPHDDSFASLRGGYVPLGVLEEATYEEYRYEGLQRGTVILLGTDGIWETAGNNDEFFGKQRVQMLLREHCHRTAKQIADEIESALGAFRGNRPVKDDITFVVVKVM